MKEDTMQQRGRIVALVFFVLDAILWFICCRQTPAPSIPQRDVVAWAIILLVLRGLLELDYTGYPQLRSIDEFHRAGRHLEVLVAVGTILLPWLLLVTLATDESKHMLAPHLFVLQAHLAGEGMIEAAAAGSDKDWLMFVYTIFANAYRAIPLKTWFGRLRDYQAAHRQEDNSIGDWLLTALPLYAFVVWLYWSFYHIPFVWYPFLEKPKKEKKADKKTK